MNNKHDISRGRRLTEDEAQSVRAIRKAVMKEFPPVTMNVVQQVVRKLRELREELGLSLADMEERTGMTRANLSRLENEARNVEIRTLDRYARGLDCRLEINVIPNPTPDPMAQAAGNGE